MTQAIIIAASLIGLGTWRLIYKLPDPYRRWRDDIPYSRLDVPEEYLSIRPTNNDWKGLI